MKKSPRFSLIADAIKKKNLRFPLIVLIGAALAGVLVFLVYRDIDRAAGVETYDQAAALAGVPDLSAFVLDPEASPEPAQEPDPTPSPAPGESDPVDPDPAPTETSRPKPVSNPIPVFEALENVDLGSLRAYNREVLGWIAIPGVFSYPLMRGQDNSFYLSHTWDGTRNSVGSVFMDYRCAADMGDFNTVIYAHRTRRGAMFGSLSKYASQSFWAAHPDVFLVTDAGISRYRIYAAYEADLEGPAYYNRVSSAAGREDFINSGVEQSGIVSDVLPSPEDSFITLSTCTGNGHSTRWVVQAFLMSDG